MWIALTHVISPNINNCELTFMNREPIDYQLAMQQHENYCSLLRACGAEVVKLSESLAHPDCCFTEDTAIVVNELGIICSMGVLSRRGEVSAVEKELAKHRPIARINLPAMIEGGDVLQAGKTIFVGLSKRTNAQGVEEVTKLLKPMGYEVITVQVKGSLHLTTAASAIDDETFLLNPLWADPGSFKNFNLLYSPEDEPWGANTFRVGDTICAEASFPKTIELLRRHHGRVEALDISEFRKAEAGLSCLSLIFRDGNQG
jgi:dimethylargininase